MTAPTAQQLTARIRRSLDDDTPHVSVVDAGQWVSDALSDIVERYSCDAPEGCEGRPAWDAAYDEMIEALMPKADAILDDALDQLAATAAEALAGYLAEHPDARLRKLEEGGTA